MINLSDTYKKEFRTNLKLAVPLVLGQLGQVFVNLADNIMVGKLGTLPLAGIAFANAIFVVFVVVGMGISFALPPLVSEADGANKLKKVSQYFKHGLLINLLFAFVSITLIEVLMPYAYMLGQEKEVLDMGLGYLRISMWTMIPMMIFLTFKGYVEGMSNTIIPMVAIIVGNAANIILNYFLIFGNGGFDEMGLNGAAVASFIARGVMVLVMILMMIKDGHLLDRILKANYLKYQTSFIKKILKLGIPTSAQMFFEVSAFSAAALIMGMVSSVAQAAHQVAISLASLTFLICTGVSMAATIRVGNNFGKKDFQTTKLSGIAAIILVTGFMIVTALGFVLFNDQLPLIYINDVDVVNLAGILLIYAAIFQIPDGVQVTALGALRGLQDVKIPTLITLLSYWVVGIPFSYISTIYWDLGYHGVWIGLILGLTISSSLLTFRFFNISNKLANIK